METTTHEYYVSHEVAKLLKEAGFDWKCNGVFISEDGTQYTFTKMDAAWDSNNSKYNQYNISAPTLEVAQKWLREVKGIHICVKADAASINCKYFVTVIINDTEWGNVQGENKKTILFNTYEEAQEAGIKKVLEIILKKGE